LQCNSDQCI